MIKAQTVYTSRLLNKKANEGRKAARDGRHHMKAFDVGYEREIPRSGVFYVNISGVTVPTA